MRPAIVVAAHPDDEVLGASAILASRPCVVVFATDGVPADARAAPALSVLGDSVPEGDLRVEEARAAHSILDARVTECIRLGFGDQRLTEKVVALADELVLLLDRLDGDVFVPAYQRGHPDHDAVFVAAQLARARSAARAREWFGYALYGLDHEGAQRFGWLEPEFFPNAFSDGDTTDGCARKAAALRAFASQLPDESVLSGWLVQPVPEQYAPLPDFTAPLPVLRCFYEEVFEFSQFGIDAGRTTAALQAALDTIHH